MARKNKKSSFGPGFLVTAAFIGPGTVTTCSLAGADFGYALLYALVFATVSTLILQEMTGRLSLGSGKDLGQALREYSGNPITRLIYIILTLSAVTFGCAAYEAGNIIGGSLGLSMITEIPQKIWVVLIALAALFILSRRAYRFVEKFLIYLVFIMSISFITTFIIVLPDIPSIISGLVPSLPGDSLPLVLALVGTTVVPYNLFLHSSAVRQKWAASKDIKNMRKDLWLSIGLGGLISMAIVITSAAAFYMRGIEVTSGAQMAEQLKPLFGPLTKWLFGIGFFAAGMSSAVTAPYAAAFASSGILGWEIQPHSRRFRAIWLIVILAGLVVSLFRFNPISVIVFAQMANGLMLPAASIFLLVILNDRRKMGGMANNWKQNLAGVTVILIVTVLGVWNIIKLFLS
jgi:manganese transport protein